MLNVGNDLVTNCGVLPVSILLAERMLQHHLSSALFISFIAIFGSGGVFLERAAEECSTVCLTHEDSVRYPTLVSSCHFILTLLSWQTLNPRNVATVSMSFSLLHIT